MVMAMADGHGDGNGDGIEMGSISLFMAICAPLG